MDRTHRVTLTIPLLPPSVNHYKKRAKWRNRATGQIVDSYTLSDETVAFQMSMRLFAGSQTLIDYVIPPVERYKLTPGQIRYRMDKVRYGLRLDLQLGPGSRLDGDNALKVSADGLAKAGVIHSDARVIDWHVHVDTETRKKDQTTIEVWIEKM